ncbi:MAG: type I secretion system permease/ATPase [Desulfobulbaceae bacterium]|jgi:PrtD family type I secretion system ABC transporter|nr:type I secretion system permease/ATPase [Desulfobulbaceae bacterium]
MSGISEFLASCQYFFGYAFFFSMFVNALQLTFPIYMLQVYDKVLTSYSVSTLVVITIAAVICLIVLAALEWIRSRLLLRAGIEFDRILSEPLLAMTLHQAAQPGAATRGEQASLRDVQGLRNFLGGRAVFAWFDLPWIPFYFALIFFLHPYLGWTAFLGGLVVFLLGALAERLTKNRLNQATSVNNRAQTFINAALRNAGVVRAMGMNRAVAERWSRMNDAVLNLQTAASSSAGLLQAITRSLRVGLQVLIYAVGAYLAVMHESTAGIMIVASIIMGRALAPVDQAMATYKQSLEAWASFGRLKKTFAEEPTAPPMSLPDPLGALEAENLHFSVGKREIIKGVSFLLPAGDSLALIGPSAAGKSTLCRLLLGIWPITRGKARLDGADIASWQPEQLGRFVGWLPQDVELFSGTVAENIARLGEADPEQVVAAARMADAHQMILGLAKGYDTPVGEHGAALSGGERQRIGLARALYGNPRLVVLDEPNANLDEDGKKALVEAIAAMKKTSVTVIIVSHHHDLLTLMDNILMMRDGRAVTGGPSQDVLRQMREVRAALAEKAAPMPERRT